ncbi:hypothetical protein Trydic_g20494 [Trypoxylus dichotomus]
MEDHQLYTYILKRDPKQLRKPSGNSSNKHNKLAIWGNYKTKNLESTIDYVFTITQGIEKKTASDQELHLQFVDLRKAYDSVQLKTLWKALEKADINVELIKILRYCMNSH